jgi:RecQ family ATP-dependent DNA helicase
MIDLKVSLHKNFGYDDFREGQEEVISAIMSGKDTLGVMATSAGKSICFQLPALESSGATIIVSPLIALMDDQVNDLTKKGIASVAIHGNSNSESVREKLTDPNIKLIYVSPEKLSDEGFISFASNRDIARIVVDEAHCISTWGFGFRPEFKRIGEHISLIEQSQGSKIQRCAFTATATKDITTDIKNIIGMNDCFEYMGTTFRDNIDINIQKSSHKKTELLKHLNSMKGEPTLIYTSTIKALNTLELELNKEGFNVGSYHGKLPQTERDSLQDKFHKNEIDILIATSAFGMGVNKPDIRNIINWQMPDSIESYYQMVGRAGRDGEKSKSVMLIDGRDRRVHEFLISMNYPKGEHFEAIQVTLSNVQQNGSVNMLRDDFLAILPIDIKPHELSSSLMMMKNEKMINIDGNSRLRENDFMSIAINNLTHEIDFDKVSDRKTKALDSLNQIDKLVESALCRNYIIEDYFSDNNISYNSCDSCDNCNQLHLKHDINNDTFDGKAAHLLHEALIDLSGKVSLMKLKNIMQGVKDKMMERQGLDVKPYFGLLTNHGTPFVNTMMSKLIKENNLSVNKTTNFVELTVLGDSFFKSLNNRNIVIKPKEELDLSTQKLDVGLYTKLRSMRNMLSVELEVSPNALLTEGEIRRIGKANVVNLNDIRELSIPESKISRIGDRVLKVIDLHKKELEKENSGHEISLG